MQHTAKDMDLILLLSFVVVFLVSYIFLSRPKGLPQGSIVFFLFIFLFIQYFKRVTHLAVIAILPCGPLCKHIYIYTNTKVI